jgi:hypothetical protein
MPIPSKDGDASRRENVTDAPEDTYGLIAADGKAQSVAKAAGLFMWRLCASAPLADFSKKTGKQTFSGSELRVALLFRQRGIAEKRPGWLLGEGRLNLQDQSFNVDKTAAHSGATTPTMRHSS